MTDNAIRLAGAHHVRLPVADLDRSFAWYGGLLGYQRDFDFKTDGRIVAYALKHPGGGPPLVLAATSTDRMVRKLSPRAWRRLHAAIYLIVPLSVLHELMAYGEVIGEAGLYTLMIPVLALVRWTPQWQLRGRALQG